MAQTGVSRTCGGSSGLGRVDDVKPLQRERRRQALLPQPIDVSQQQRHQQQQQQQQQNLQEQHSQQNQQQQQRLHQYEYDVDEMEAQMHHQLGGYIGDGNTLASSTVSGGNGSGGGGVGGGAAPTSSTTMKSPATSTHSAQSRKLSATRKNMMQRRIEMRRKNEERQQQEKIMPQQQQLSQQSQSEAPYTRQAQHTIHNNPRDDNDRHANYNARPVSQKSYLSQQQNHSQGHGIQQQQHDMHYSNNFDQSPEMVQLQHQHPQSQGRQPQLQHHQYQSQDAQHSNQAQFQQSQQPHQPGRQPQLHHHQYQSQDAQQSNHHPYRAQLQQSQQPQLALLSPPALQRTGESQYFEQAIHQYNVVDDGNIPMDEGKWDGRGQYSFDVDIPGETDHYQVYSQNDLERSGIIRDSHTSAQPQQQQQQQHPTGAGAASGKLNELKNCDSPSDEWYCRYSPTDDQHGYNSSGGGAGFDSAGMIEQQRLLGNNRYHQQPHQQPVQYLQSQQYPRSQSHAGQRQPQQQHPGQNARHVTESQQHTQTNTVGHQGVLKYPSSIAPSKQGGSVMKPSEYSDHNGERDETAQQEQSQSQSQLTQGYHELHDQNQFQSQSQPNWKDIKQLHHDDNRLRFFKRQLTSRQQYQDRQQQQVDSQNQGYYEQQHPTLQRRQQQNEDALLQQQRQNPPSEPSGISAMSPLDHLGNRTDHIQRKNKFMPSPPSKSLSSSPPTGFKGHHPLTFASNNDSVRLDEEVSEQARRFDYAAELAGTVQGHLSRGRNRQQVMHQQQQQDEDTASVASIRKVWVDKTNILKEQQQQQAQRLAQQRRREQKRSIEDRWMNNRRRDTVKSVPPPEKRGYKSQQHELVAGYHSEGERRSSSRPERYDGGYQSQDPDAITPKDARRRLWDEQERLRVVLPKNEKFACNDVKGRWSDRMRGSEHSNNYPSPPSQFQDGLASPGNNSGSSLGAGGRFKSKFVHAAALATQQRLANIENDDKHLLQHSQQSQWQHKQQQQLHDECQHQHQSISQQQQQQECTTTDDKHLLQHSQQSQWQHKQQQKLYDESQRQHQSNSQKQQHVECTTNKKNYSQKGIGVSSHYNDSGTETTADITTIPEGSNGSSPNRGTPKNNSILMSSNLVARRVSPSPPKRDPKTQNYDNTSPMPPIDEQGVPPEQTQTVTTSVADLIAQINAVSRSNPAEALAAIDSIIKKGGGGYGNDHRNVGGRRSNVGEPASMAPHEVSRSGPQGHGVVEGHLSAVGASAIMAHQGVSRSGPAPVFAPTPSKIARDYRLLGQGRHIGKEFFDDDEIQCIDREKDARGVAVGGRDNDDDDDSVLSSDDSTVSSMTNPTYQSIQPQKVSQSKATPSPGANAKATPSTVSSMTEPTYQSIRPKPRKATLSTTPQEPINSVGDHGFIQKSSQNQQLEKVLPVTSQKSRDSLKREYTAVKTSQSRPSVLTEEPKSLTKSSTSAWVPIPQQRDSSGKINSESKNALRSKEDEMKHWPFTRTTPTAPNNSNDNHMAYDQRTSEEKPAHTQKGNTHGRSKVPTQDKAPRDNMNTKPKTIDYPEIMMVVSDAFADVDINLEATTTTTTDRFVSLKQSRTVVPLVQTFTAGEDTVEGPLPSIHHRHIPSSACSASLQETISEAFSDVDISFGQEKTVSERRKQLEYLSASWVEDKKSRVHESSKVAPKIKNEEKIRNSEIFAGSAWVRDSLHKTQATSANQKKKVEPTMRLKGNKNLAKKFARLVNAFE